MSEVRDINVNIRVTKSYKIIQDPKTFLFGVLDDNEHEVFPCVYSEIKDSEIYFGIYVLASRKTSKSNIPLWGVLRLDTGKEEFPCSYESIDTGVRTNLILGIGTVRDSCRKRGIFLSVNI